MVSWGRPVTVTVSPKVAVTLMVSPSVYVASVPGSEVTASPVTAKSLSARSTSTVEGLPAVTAGGSVPKPSVRLSPLSSTVSSVAVTVKYFTRSAKAKVTLAGIE